MKVHLFALCYLTAYIAYSSIGSMSYAIYNQYNLSRVILVTGIFTFIGFGTSNAIVIHLIKKLNLKKSVFIGFSGFMITQFVVLLTIIAVQNEIPIISNIYFLYFINSTSGLLGGISNALVWTVNPIYIQMVLKQTSMTSKMGLFWSIYMWGTIIGGLINIFVLGYINTYVYLMVVLGFSVLALFLTSIFMEPFKIQQTLEQDQQKSIKTVFINIAKIMKNKWPNVFLFSLFSGLFLNYYVVFINNIIVLSLPEDISNQKIQRMTAIVFICQGIAAIGTGLLQRIPKYGEMNKQKYLRISLIMLEFNMIITILSTNLLDHQNGIFWISIGIMCCWQITEIHMKTGIDAYIREYHQGRVQSIYLFYIEIVYSISLFFFSFGSIISYFILMVINLNTSLLLVNFIGIIFSIIWLARDGSNKDLTNYISLKKSEKMIPELLIEEQS